MIIINQIIKRPYVFIFLITFLFIGIRSRGYKSTMAFLLIGYTIAWASEALSIRYGFPYGRYFYIYGNLRGEIMNMGVPVWDSLSYTFLCFAGLSVAEFVSPKGLVKTSVLAALFVLILDIIVDPLAHMGDRWFLGKIYYYQNPGLYFGVPVSNFAGWYLIAFAITGMFLFLERRGGWRQPAPASGSLILQGMGAYGGVALYFGIVIFNLAITAYLHAWALLGMSILWASIPCILLIRTSVLDQWIH